ncbi:MAG: radical SAM protein [Chloroflexota bacterium]
MLDVGRLLCGNLNAGEVLRHGRNTATMPRELLRFSQDKKPVVVWNTSRRCNLHCIHCYTESNDQDYPNELSRQEGLALIDQLADFGVPVLLLSGGEPLYRPDILELASYAVGKGLRVVLSTNGSLITPELAREIKTAEVSYAGVSLDGVGEVHDRFRGVKGTFQKSLEGIRHCQEAGVKAGLRFTITRHNYHQIDDIFQLVVDEGIGRLCFYHLVDVGRGKNRSQIALQPHETRVLVGQIFQKTRELYQKGYEKEVLMVDNHADAPYMYLKLLEEDPQRAKEVYNLMLWNGGNNSGIAFGCVDEQGFVHPDQFWRNHSLGNVRQRPFGEIWTDTSNPLMAGLKDRKALLEGRCSECRFLEICNGNFRARAEAAYGRVWAQDPACYLTDQEIDASVPLLEVIA